MKRPEHGRALFYTRDSGGKHEMTPGGYVIWARDDASRRGLAFSGTPEQLDRMIKDGQFANGDLFVDYDVKGHILVRDGLSALMSEAAADMRVSHIYIPRRDRLARPNNPIDGVQIEQQLHSLGITLVFTDKISLPTPPGERQNVGDLIVSVLDYDQSGKFRKDLAHKIILAQIGLAKSGYSTGGRPPYGFRRWLVKNDGTQVRQLADGERVRMAGHHVVWLPGPDEEIATIARILKMLESTPASRVAAQLTAEGIPTPDASRYRTDGGVRHKTSGVWHATTIVNIARNRLLQAVVAYGRRSMGDQLRLSPNGPRPLTDSDFRADNKPKVIANNKDGQIVFNAHFKPVVDTETHERLLAILDARAGTQRGKPRSRDPSRNPLGARVFDMNCNWPMYRAPYRRSFRYVCGCYTQSHGATCSHNWIDGPLAVQFTMSCLLQRMFTFKGKMEACLRQLAARDAADNQGHDEIRRLEERLACVEKDLTLAKANLARAENDQQFEAIASRFDQLDNAKKALQGQLVAARANRQPSDAEAEIALAMGAARRLAELSSEGIDLAEAAELFKLANARLYLRFKIERLEKRSVNRVKCGVLTLGDAPAPIKAYDGPTARNKLTVVATATNTVNNNNDKLFLGSGMEGNPLGNANRGD